jgi:DMSO/TMAO reductase YedYZ molybdopterin-dependent catalytic subunit
VWLGLEGALDALGSRGGARRFTGSHEITDPEQIPATQWLDDRVPHIDPGSHEVSVVGRPHSVDELAARGDVVRATLDCTGGWYTTQEWAGTRLSRLLGDVVGSSIVVLSVTGYWRRFPFDQADSLYLVTHMAGEPLRQGNGGPVRIVAPGRRGYWWVKWVRFVEVDDSPSWWQPPLPMA